MKLVYKIILIVISILTLLLLSYFFVFKKEFIVKSELEEVINYNEKYKEQKINIVYGNKLLGYKKITKINNISNQKIDTSKLKEYKIKYKIKYKNKSKVIEKVIKVKDLEKPVIEVDNKEVLNICPNTEEYNLEYKAIDNYDKDITDKVVRRIENNILYLEVEDSSHNKEIKTINVDYKDIEKPNISLKGKDLVKIMIGEKYNEEGANASDNCDGDISKNIKITNDININKSGMYTVTYNVKDSSGNENKITRKVAVFDKNNPSLNGKTIYLTFDDGPYKYTDKLLNVLDKYNVQATFFVTNQYPAYQNLIKKEYERGHAIGIHSYSHNYSNIYSSLDNYYADLNKISNIIKNQTGIETKLVRLPGGSSNTISKKYKEGIMTEITLSLTEKGYHYYDWNVSSGDAGNTTKTSKIVSNVVKSMESGKTLVVLQHDIKDFSVNAVEEIITEGLKRGYVFKKLDEESFAAHQTVAN